MSNALRALRTAVVGLGPMGMHHVRAAKDMPATSLVAVVDTDRARADAVATEFGCRPLYQSADLVGLVDAVTVATPPEFHWAAARPLLGSGIACLIEKPLALTEVDSTAIVDTATSNNVIVGIGHIERFNPATEVLFQQQIRGDSIREISVRRFSPASGRQVPVDVVSDMMIHDLEIVLALKQSAVVAVEAEGTIADWANARLTFADGAIATIATNRKAEGRVRELVVSTGESSYHLDFMERTLSRKKNGTVEPFTTIPHDALRAETADFLEAIRSERRPRVTAHDARDAMRVAWRILDCIKGRSA
jgi:predicted dehydrogenase